VFVLEARVEVVREQILRASREERFALIAYCFMPDHLHLLVHGQAEDADSFECTRQELIEYVA
jgi:REP element-mobilizing transposase RayT